MELIGRLIQFAIWLLMMAIFGSVIISWLRASRVRVPYGSPLVRAIEETAELMLRPIRRMLPTTAGGLDFAPMVAIIILYMLQGIIARL